MTPSSVHAGDKEAQFCRHLNEQGERVTTTREVPALPEMLQYGTDGKRVREEPLLPALLRLIEERTSMTVILRVAGTEVTTNAVETLHHQGSGVHSKQLATGNGHGYAGEWASFSMRAFCGWALSYMAAQLCVPWPTSLALLGLYAARDKKNSAQLARKGTPAAKAKRTHKGQGHLALSEHQFLEQKMGRDYDAAPAYERQLDARSKAAAKQLDLPAVEARIEVLEAYLSKFDETVFPDDAVSGNSKIESSDMRAATDAELQLLQRATQLGKAALQQAMQAALGAAELPPEHTALVTTPRFVKKHLTKLKSQRTRAINAQAIAAAPVRIGPPAMWNGDADTAIMTQVLQSRATKKSTYGGGKSQQRKEAAAAVADARAAFADADGAESDDADAGDDATAAHAAAPKQRRRKQCTPASTARAGSAPCAAPAGAVGASKGRKRGAAAQAGQSSKGRKRAKHSKRCKLDAHELVSDEDDADDAGTAAPWDAVCDDSNQAGPSAPRKASARSRKRVCYQDACSDDEDMDIE